jgi:hypothetical protein
VHDFDGKVPVSFVPFKLLPDHILLAHQNDLDFETPGGLNRPFDFGFGGVVSAHCIHRNGQHVGKPLLGDDFDYFAALILAAMRAYTMGELGLVAVGTFRQAGRLQRIVRAAVAGPPLGVSAFGIRHISTSTNSVQFA